MRIRATNNVAKLTNVMKLVASSKLRAVEEALNRGRPFGVSYTRARARVRVGERVGVGWEQRVGDAGVRGRRRGSSRDGLNRPRCWRRFCAATVLPFLERGDVVHLLYGRPFFI